MANQICFRCFKIKGEYEVCPHCGYIENTRPKQVYQLKPGTVLRDRYIIGTSIGFGGFGITYKAFDTSLEVVVAIKEFYPAGLVNRGEGEVRVGIFSGDKEKTFKRQLERFLEEARNMAIFSKEKDIINVYDYFEENQTAYIIMEYVDSPLLKTYLKEKGRLSQEEAVGYMQEVLRALSKIHGHGIIHKDISPDNIFLTGPNSIKIFDFGAAKFKGTESERTEVVVVKAGYTPPEQYRSKNQQGPFMDIYAAGAVLYEMITGEKPVDAPDRAVEDELKKPSEFGVPVDEHLERVILKALALRPELRFQTAQQFREALTGSKKVGLPEEEIKKHLLRKRILTFASAAVILAAGVAVVLSQTVFSTRGRIDITKIEEDELEIWMSAEGEDAGKAISDALTESVKKECPQLNVSVKVIDKAEYAAQLQQAAQEERLPEVFCTDGVEASDYCEDLSRLLRTMELSSYLYFGGLGKGQKVYEIPTALQVGVAYGSEEKENDLPTTIDINQMPVQGEVWGYADEEEIYSRLQDGKDSLVYVMGDLSDMEQVKEVTVEMIPPTDFEVIPILSGGKLIGSLENCYGVSKMASDNQKEAGMFLLSLLMSEGMQSAAYMDNEEGIPLNRNVLDDYEGTKMTTYLAFLREYDLEECTFLQGDGICRMLREQIGGE